MFRKIGLLFVLVFAGIAQADADVSVSWSGFYGGKFYPPRSYTRTDLCCRNPNCGMRQQILGLIGQRERDIALATAPIMPVPEPIEIPAVAEVKPTAPPVTGMIRQSYQVQVPYQVTVEEPVRQSYQVKVCDGRRCRIETRYRTVMKNRVETRYRIETRYREIPKPEPKKEETPISTVVEATPEDLVLSFQPTPMPAVRALLKEIQPQPGELVVDLGCGDGRFVVEAAKKYGCQGLGIELNPKTAAMAFEAADEVEGVQIVEGDVLKEDWSHANIVIMHLYDDLMAEVWPQIPAGTLVCSVNHELPGPCRKVVREGQWFYVAIKR